MTEKPASPVCYADEADDAYMGYAQRQEILDVLNALLEMERACSRIALASSQLEEAVGYGCLMLNIHEDAAHWCGMLGRHIQSLGGDPSPKTGSFFKKAMALAETLERLALFNHEQSRMVRKLEHLMPRIRDNALHRGLKAMTDKKRAAIEWSSEYLHEARKKPPSSK
ncbi:DUF6306 domain-containing protein [Novosphingobium sp. KN65.2]|uniref:DUF6306 domain-containing protein n=1 Tax=Novosphingobium sp. KN65.2 TaxID=1478134 RepID=UPI0005E66323|nr:DUF6306 domain-containing protein [Novosphingobium sp. KN65.2]CDO38909.1 conserved hypothetical protein [Novosphingobium sp. KN65.2]